jgi:hypothetical protein
LQVTISPEPAAPANGVYREVVSKLVSEHQQGELGGRLLAYDDGTSLFTAGALPFDSKEFEVALSAGDGKAGYVNSASLVRLVQYARSLLDERINCAGRTPPSATS